MGSACISSKDGVGIPENYGIVCVVNQEKRMNKDYETIERIIFWLDANAENGPEPETLAEAMKISPVNLQKLCRRWAGVSTEQVMAYASGRHAKRRLNRSAQASWSPSRHRVQSICTRALESPGSCQTIQYGYHGSIFGPCLIGMMKSRVCYLGFGEGCLPDLKKRWPYTTLVENVAGTADPMEQIFRLRGGAASNAIGILLKGTEFQLKVWHALLQIPAGMVFSYGELARHIQHPLAARAVGKAVGMNPVAYLIPCHRVLQASGAFHGYRWGVSRKKAMLIKEWSSQSG